MSPLLRALQHQQLPDGHDLEVIAVVAADDASRLKDGGCTVVTVPALLPPGCMRNLGARRATGTLLAFIDDDCMPPDNWLSVLAGTLLGEPRCAAVGCRVVSASSGFWNACADVALFWPYQYPLRIRTALGSAALVVRREAFEQVGGFDETLMATEDWDFCLRLAGAGWHCIHEPAVVVAHDHRRGSARAILRQAYHSGRRSGLEVQRRHAAQMTWLARASLALGRPGLYWLLILPNAGLNAALQVLPFVRTQPAVLLFAPFILLARIAYHVGVWKNLCRSAGRRDEP